MVLPVILGDSTSPQGYHRFLTVGYIWAHAQLSSLWGLRKRASSLPDGQTGTAALTRSSETVPGALPFHWCPQSCPCTTLAQVFRGEQRLCQPHGPAALHSARLPPSASCPPRHSTQNCLNLVAGPLASCSLVSGALQWGPSGPLCSRFLSGRARRYLPHSAAPAHAACRAHLSAGPTFLHFPDKFSPAVD